VYSFRRTSQGQSACPVILTANARYTAEYCPLADYFVSKNLIGLTFGSMKKLSYLLFLFLSISKVTTACTIFIGSNGRTTLVGNNEDFTPSLDTYIWLRPKMSQANGYIFWGFNEKKPEGGMNDHGLFIDAAALPAAIPINRDPNKPEFQGYLTETILRECTTVADVINWVKKYNLTWQEKAQLLVADRSGDYAVIHANYIIRKTTCFFALTNYSQLDTAYRNFSCWRRNTAYKYLANGNISVERFRDVLSKTAQTELYNATVYSQVCDLKKGVVYLYRFHDFSKCDTIHLAKMLLKGKQDIEIRSLFPKRIGDTVLAETKKSSVIAAIRRYGKLKDTPGYDFSEMELNRAGYALLNDGRLKDAIAIFRLNLKAYPSSFGARADLAGALLLDGRVQQADRLNAYTQLLKVHPDSLVNFLLRGFEVVKRVTLNIKPSPAGIEQHLELVRNVQGYWTCTAKLPPGNYSYNFKVGDAWITDPANQLAVRSGDYWNSFLVVRK
jgi:tetratricopeptide (TPR) repeat protein